MASQRTGGGTVKTMHFETQTAATFCRRFSFTQSGVYGTIRRDLVTCKWCLKRLAVSETKDPQ